MLFLKILTISLIVSIIASVISIQAHAATSIRESFSLLMTSDYVELWAISFISILIASTLAAKTSSVTSASSNEIGRASCRERV